MSHYSMRGSIAVITMNHPPMNTMSLANRRGVSEAMKAALMDNAVKGIVLTGSERAFSSGAEIKEFNLPEATASPHLGELISAIEMSAKPVVAAISGLAMGGGLELALACHYRTAQAKAQIALPEVKLGLLPGAGGTQRLPRLIGAEQSLNMIVSGAPVPAGKFMPNTLFDVIADDSVMAACTWAEKMVAQGAPWKRASQLKVNLADSAAFFELARKKVTAESKGFPAPLKCVSAVEAAVTLPFEEGMRCERELFMELVETTESKALRHYFFGERTVAKIPDISDDTALRPIRTVAVIGAGTMGGGIAMNFANVGIPVMILEMSQGALDKGLDVVRKNYAGSVKRGRMSQEEMDKRMSAIRPTLSYADIGGVDMVIEAVFEDMSVKEKVFKELDRVMRPGAILASNTSTLDLDKIASFTARPADVIGTHFFSPANVMRLLEIVRGKHTAKDVVATTMKLAKTIKKVGVLSGVCDGFIGNRMIARYSGQAMRLIEEGALPQQVDAALENWGMAMGPFRMADLAGNDIGWYIRKRHYAEHPNMRREKVADALCEMGRFGQKTGAGFYRYEAGSRTAHLDPMVEELILRTSKEQGLARRVISDTEIVSRCIYALVNEGGRILSEGIALRAVDIDMIYMTGYGFPMYRGGPMFYANTVGLSQVAETMREYDKAGFGSDGFWAPAPIFR